MPARERARFARNDLRGLRDLSSAEVVGLSYMKWRFTQCMFARFSHYLEPTHRSGS
jgi:hypothetical protein